MPDIEIETIRITEASPLTGKTLAEAMLRTKYGVTVLAIQRGRETITNPSGDTQLLAHDIVVMMGTRDSIVGVYSLTPPRA